MYPIAHLGPKDVVYQAMLGEPRHAAEGRRDHHSVEVMSVAADLRPGTGDARLDPLLELLGSGRHIP